MMNNIPFGLHSGQPILSLPVQYSQWLLGDMRGKILGLGHWQHGAEPDLAAALLRRLSDGRTLAEWLGQDLCTSEGISPPPQPTTRRPGAGIFRRHA